MKVNKLNKEVLENHKRYIERQRLYQSFGYDLDQERSFILAQAQPVNGRILDAGTGKGHFALTLAKAGYNFITFDIVAEEQRIARMNLTYFGLEKAVDFRIENAERTSFKDGSFDTVFSVNVLHHLDNPYLVLAEFIRLLSSSGKLIIADFTEEGFKLMDRIHDLEGHKHETGKITLAETQDYLIGSGFNISAVKSKYQAVIIATRLIA